MTQSAFEIPLRRPPLRDYGSIALIFLVLIGAWIALPWTPPGMPADSSKEFGRSGAARGSGGGDRIPASPNSLLGENGQEYAERGAGIAQAGSVFAPAPGGPMAQDAARPGVAAAGHGAAAVAKGTKNNSTEPDASSSAGSQTSAQNQGHAIVSQTDDVSGNLNSARNIPSNVSKGSNRNAIKPGVNRGPSLSALFQADKMSAHSLTGKDEMASAVGKKTFDAANLARGSSGMPLSGEGILNGGVPADLKIDDASLDFKKFKAPDIGPVSEVKDVNNPQYLQEQLMMALVAVAFGGVLGPVFQAMGQNIARGIGLTPPSPGAMNRVPETAPKLPSSGSK